MLFVRPVEFDSGYFSKASLTKSLIPGRARIMSLTCCDSSE